MSRELVLCMAMMSQTIGAADFGLSKDHLTKLQTTEQTTNKTNATNMAVQSQYLSNGTGAQQQQQQKMITNEHFSQIYLCSSPFSKYLKYLHDFRTFTRKT